MSDVIDIFTTGGTIDKVYFDALSEFQIGPAAIPDMLRENNVHVPHRVTQLMRKDSLELDDADREAIRAAVAAYRTEDSVLGPFSFDANGDTTLSAMSGNMVKNGKYEFVTTLTNE